jgi:hypothetical protein
MKFIKLISLATAVILVLGCELTGPSVKVEPPKVKVDGVKIEDGSKNGDFCPPGQAKKGNC